MVISTMIASGGGVGAARATDPAPKTPSKRSAARPADSARALARRTGQLENRAERCEDVASPSRRAAPTALASPILRNTPTSPPVEPEGNLLLGGAAGTAAAAAPRRPSALASSLTR